MQDPIVPPAHGHWTGFDGKSAGTLAELAARPSDDVTAKLAALCKSVDRFLRGGATLNDLTEAVAAAELVTA